MKITSKSLLFLFSFFILFLLPLSPVLADDDHHEEKKWYKKIFDDDDKHDKHESEYLTPVNNETFKEECGACHFAYQPGLLPSGSWENILNNLPSHFGEDVSLDQESKKIIGKYLKINAAETSSAKRARKIMKSLNGQTPLRITQTP